MSDYPDVKTLKLISTNVELQGCIKNWCEEKKIHFEWTRSEMSSDKTPILKKSFDWLPYSVQVFLWLLKYLFERWSLRGVGVNEWKKEKSEITFISYLYNLHPDSYQKGYFGSDYWADLPQALSSNNLRSKWLHIYIKNSMTPSASSAANLVKKVELK